ncbi:hypothetical protein IMG5_115070 [Ichthyophthirius multifiliis]|uniref:Hflx-type G domain-containing protein n=1 Tax=Ichthyophthirius multifiliis TaxID=5932 RepID=G0QU66_ICHMU|nr:hypothetical protein IMG5_115070 [Ichthyophthirius multifiliis]EGR31247.1 hypothetical protein IMG5_115070 [Ichthyophthirius multifiliis]|eukprot:XP_004034733.1 hypothetical protein IMG5_115070 [Ichthyophthirius multifiliis]
MIKFLQQKIIQFQNKSLFNLPRQLYQSKEQLDFRKQKQIHSFGFAPEIKCLIIHPVLYPNKGPEIELYLAEEAIGLAKSLNWAIEQGPFWKQEQKQIELKEKNQDENYANDDDQYDLTPGGRIKKPNNQLKNHPGWELAGEANLKDGDYIYTPYFKGTYYKSGIIVDLESESDEDADLQHEWQNRLLRESIAKSSLMKVKRIIGKTYFTKGKLLDLGLYIKDKNIDCVFINSEITTTQQKNLEKIWSNIVNGKEEEAFFKKNPQQSSDTEVESDDGLMEKKEDNQYQDNDDRKIKVFDRFTIILQIFAKRAQTQISKLQIEISFLNYMKTKVQRDGGQTFSSVYSIFKGDLMSVNELNIEIVSAKSRATRGKASGQGETQLELQKRLIDEKLSKLKKDLSGVQQQQTFIREKRNKQHNNIPKISLIGYTNSGKSALMNALVKKEVVESKDNLFQTLSTTSRKIQLIQGQKAIILDTIGFITNLPHELVESFKSTLEEVQNSDLFLHVRDISHPQTEQQKQTVLQVLKDLKFDQSFYSNKMIEVWNKMDLVKNKVDYKDALKQDFPSIPVSALYNTNIGKLVEVMEQKVNELMNKKYYNLINPLEQHKQRFDWLYLNGNITRIENEVYNYDQTKQYPYGCVQFSALLDDVTYRRYCTTFGIQLEEKIYKKNLPPKEWLQGSQSYFEKKKKDKIQEDQEFFKNAKNKKQ